MLITEAYINYLSQTKSKENFYTKQKAKKEKITQ